MSIARMKELYDVGVTPKEIGEKFFMDRATVRRQLRLAGVKMRPKGYNGGGRHVPFADIVETSRLYWEEDLFAWEVAERLGIGIEAVNHRMRRSARGTRTQAQANELVLRRKAAGTYRVRPKEVK